MQAVEVAALHGVGKGQQQALQRCARDHFARGALAQLQPGAPHQLADGGRGLVKRLRDVFVVGVKHVAHQEGRAGVGCQAFQHEQKRHRHIVGQLVDLFRGGGRRGHQHGLGQPYAGVMGAFGLGGAQAVNGQARGGRDQPGFGVLHRVAVGAVPTQPGFLYHVFRLGHRAQHAIGNGVQAGAVTLEEGRGVGHGGSQRPGKGGVKPRILPQRAGSDKRDTSACGHGCHVRPPRQSVPMGGLPCARDRRTRRAQRYARYAAASTPSTISACPPTADNAANS
ncbi:hypothetical protein D3C77_449100 [compost metagenome]